MARPRRMTAPFSLLAFQDIITSVSGILIFTTLLLALDLTERDFSRRSDSPAEPASPLARDLAEAEARRDSLAAQLAGIGEQAEDTIRHRRPDAARQVEALKQAVIDAEAQANALEVEARQAQRLQNKAEETATGRENDREQLQAKIEELGRLRQELETLKDSKLVAYAFDDQARRKGWLVELGDDRIAAAPLDQPAPPTVFSASGLFGDRALADFLAWARNRPQPERYFLIVVRPSGRDRYDAISETFRKENIAFGYDLIAASQRVLDPHRGVFQP